MRRIVNYVIVLLLLVPAVGFAIDNKDKNKKKQKLIIPGRWREEVRMMPDSSMVTFYDTLFLRFYSTKDSFEYRNGRNNFLYDGQFQLSEDSILDLGTAKYKVLARRRDSLVLVNAYGIYLLGVDRSDTAEAVVIKKQDTARPVNNIDVMIGRWTVYKREADGPIDADENIRSAHITGPSTDGKQGFIYSGSDMDSYPSWHIKELGGGQSLNCAGKSNRTLKVLRCQNGEMVLEENKIKYYFKLHH